MMQKKSYNIAIVTPFYPINHRDDLFEDTKAIYYLIKEFPKNSNNLIIHCYMHGFRDIWRHLWNVLPIKSNWKCYLHKDDYNNDVLFFEILLPFPRSIKTLDYFNNRYADLINDYCLKNNYFPEVGVVHFPTYFSNLLPKCRYLPKKIAIIHSFDIKNIKNRKDLNYWNDYFNKFDAIGFRSYIIKREFQELINFTKRSFMCLSGIPKMYVDEDLGGKQSYNINEKIKLLFAGRLDSNKNVNKTISALGKLSQKINFSFTIIGDGEERKRLEIEARRVGVLENVYFKGVLSRNETFEYMLQSDIFIMISKKETLGLVYLEAMAAGCIVIGTRGQGIDGIIIDGENGFLTDSQDEEEIFQTIYRVMNLSSSEQKRIRKNAKNTIKSLTDTLSSQKYFKNISSIIQEGSFANE